MKKIRINCDYLYYEDKYYCSTKTQYPIAVPEKCEIITNYDGLKKFIEKYEDQYIFYLPPLTIKMINDEKIKYEQISLF